MSGSYFLHGFILEKCGIFLKNGRFSGRILSDWGNTAWADMAGLGSIGLNTGASCSLVRTVGILINSSLYFCLYIKSSS